MNHVTISRSLRRIGNCRQVFGFHYAQVFFVVIASDRSDDRVVVVPYQIEIITRILPRIDIIAHFTPHSILSVYALHFDKRGIARGVPVAFHKIIAQTTYHALQVFRHVPY